METLKFCIKILFRASKWYSLILVIITIIASIIPFLSLNFSSKLIQVLSENIGNNNIQYKDFIFILIAIFLINLFSKVIEYIRTYMNTLLNELVDKETDVLLINKSSYLDLAFFDSNSFYNEIKDVSLNKLYLINTIFFLVDLIKALIQLLIAIFSLATISWIGSIFLSLSIIPNIFTLKHQYSTLYGIQRADLSSIRKKNYFSLLSQDKNFAKEIKIYNLGPFFIEKYKNLWSLLFKKKKKTMKKYTYLLILSSILPEIITIAIFFLLCHYVFSGVISIGDFTYYQGIINQVLVSMLSFVLIFSQIKDGSDRVENFIKFLAWKNNVLDQGNRILSQPKKIIFENVSFRYADNLPLVLKNLNFTLQTNQLNAFVGTNGCGKSTIIKLLLRFYDPTYGRILIDGIDLKDYTLESVHTYFGTLFQDYGKYAFTVKESTYLSDIKNMNDTIQIEKALRSGGAYTFVQNYPLGIDTQLTRQFAIDGVELSGGQWQSLALSRSFFQSGAGMFLFDEPSSSLDAEAEANLFQKIENLYRKKGGIVISHRLSNIMKADMIYVMEDGIIIEKGTHAQLMERKGKYAKLFHLQIEKYGVKYD